jgi:hypothetical protein
MLPLRLSIFILLAITQAACASRFMASETTETGGHLGGLEEPSQVDPGPQPASELEPPISDPPHLLVRSTTSGLLYPLDASSGEAVPGYEPIPSGPAYSRAFSPDGQRLAFVSEGGGLTLIDLPAWEYQSYRLQLPRPAYQVVYSPQGDRLAVAGGRHSSSLALIDLARMEVVAESELDFLVHEMKYTPDGSGLMVYGTVIENRFTVNEVSPGPPRVVLLDGERLDIIWAEDLPGVEHGIIPKDGKLEAGADLHQPGQALYKNPGLVFAPQRALLYLVHAGQDLLTTVDFSTRQVSTLEMRDRLSWVERLLALGAGRARAKIAEGDHLQAVISPDGGRLFVIGASSRLRDPQGDSWEIEHTPLGLQVIDPESGERLAWYQNEASSLALSPDGGSLYLRAWGEDRPWTEVFDIPSGEVVARLEGTFLEPLLDMHGRPLLVSSIGGKRDTFQVTVLDPRGLQTLGEWTSQGYLMWISP